jgi:ubiquinone/menaquinone biosynthesis C-methylase UbiE
MLKMMKKILEEIKRVLEPNGVLVLSTPRYIKFFNFLDPAWL